MRSAIITKQFSFESAHQLTHHNGKCKNLHGHSYHVEIGLQGRINDNNVQSDYGMVVDYADVKEVVKPIINDMDHAFLCDQEQWVTLNTVNNPFGNDIKLYNVGARTTAENLAWHIMDKIYMKLPVAFVTVKETESSSATVLIEDFLCVELNFKEE